MKKIPLWKICLLSLSVATLSGCASSGSQNNTSRQIITNSQGQTQARIQDSNVYNTQGQRTHRIDSRGNIYATTGAQAGQRVGRIGK